MTLPLDTIFQQVAAVLLVAAIIGALARLLRQPLIISFIAVGIVAGPLVLDIVRESEEIELLAQIGISILLFIVGLKLDLRLIRTLGPVALATGLGQVAFTSAVGLLLTLAMGLDFLSALYVAIALTFSSTIVIVKLLSDRGEIEQLHGRIAIGYLIVQDIVVVLVMIGLSAFGDADGEQLNLGLELLAVAVRGAVFVGAIVILMRWVLPPLLRWIAQTPELLLLFAVAWALTLAVAGELLGFSEEVGAFLAGVSLASTPYREALAARLATLRDFLLLFFFVDLGARMDIGQAADQLGPALVLSLFVLAGKPLIMMAIMASMRYRRRVSFLAGLTTAQISEFSLIFAALGVGLGHIGEETLSLITTVGVITIGLSTYMILNSHRLFERLEPLLGIFERGGAEEHDFGPDAPPPEIIVIGLGRYGGEIATTLSAGGRQVLGVDFDPSAMDRFLDRGVRVVYGDVEDPQLPEVLPLDRAQWVVSTVRTLDANLAMLQALAHHGYRGRVAVSADRDGDADLLREHGATLVLIPLRDAAAAAVRRIEDAG